MRGKKPTLPSLPAEVPLKPLVEAPERLPKPVEAITKRDQSDAVISKRAAASMRRELVPVPVLPTDEIESYVDKKAVDLLPDAVAEVEYQLKYGDDKQRLEAAHDVLDMNGRRKREGLGNNTQTIVLNLGNAKLPWEIDVTPQKPSTVLTHKAEKASKAGKAGT